MYKYLDWNGFKKRRAMFMAFLPGVEREKCKNTVDCKVSGKENYKRNVNENSVCT